MERSSGSIMDNVAEGFGRGGNLEFRTFLGYSKGSCADLKSQIYRACDKQLISNDQFTTLCKLCDKESAKIGSFINYLTRTEYKGTKFRK